MPQSENQQESGVETAGERSAKRDSQTTLLIVAMVFAGIAAVVAGGYGIHSQLLTLKALALEALLVAITCWTARHAQKIRWQWAAFDHDADEDRASGSEEPRVGRWGDMEWSDEHDPFQDPEVDLEHARFVHYLYVSICPIAVVAVLALFQFGSRAGDRIETMTLGAVTAMGLVCLTGSCVWLVLARSFAAVAEDQLAESRHLAFSFRELQWISMLVAFAILSQLIWESADIWSGRLLLLWILAVCTEQIIRLLFLWLRPSESEQAFLPVLHLRLREAVAARQNPIASLFQSIETHLGVSFRSSWAIRFVQHAITPLVVLVLILLWGLSSLAVVKIDHLGVRESLGRVDKVPLQPGLHWKMPWPFGTVRQYPAKKVSVTSIGFVSNPERQQAYLWSQQHAEEEFNLVLGNEAEVMSIGTLVYYKIHEDKERFLDYVYCFQNPEEALKAYAYHALMEQTRSATLEEILTTNRAKFANELERLLRRYASENHLGIDVVDVALIGFHPPIAAAPDYLDVISAHIDADRFQIEATGTKKIQIEDARRTSASAVAQARAEAERRIGEAQEESSEFIAIGEAYAVAPDALKQRLWFEVFEEILRDKQFALVDKTLEEDGGGILLDQRAGADISDPVPVTGSAKR